MMTIDSVWIWLYFSTVFNYRLLNVIILDFVSTYFSISQTNFNKNYVKLSNKFDFVI